MHTPKNVHELAQFVQSEYNATCRLDCCSFWTHSRQVFEMHSDSEGADGQTEASARTAGWFVFMIRSKSFDLECFDLVNTQSHIRPATTSLIWVERGGGQSSSANKTVKTHLRLHLLFATRYAT